MTTGQRSARNTSIQPRGLFAALDGGVEGFSSVMAVPLRVTHLTLPVSLRRRKLNNVFSCSGISWVWNERNPQKECDDAYEINWPPVAAYRWRISTVM
jgi:hypothetical protein